MPNALQIDFIAAGIIDATTGNPLAGGKIHTFDAGTNNPQTTWQDADKAATHANPVILDAVGHALIFADGNLKIRIDDANDVTQFTLDGLFYDPSPDANRSRKTVTANFTLTQSEDLVLADSTSGNITLSLPKASDNDGREYDIVKIASTNKVIVDPNGTETINGETTFDILDLYGSISIRSDGSNWIIVSSDFTTGIHTENIVQQAIATGVATKVEFDNETFDAQSWYDISLSRFQPKVAGIYQINAQVQLLNAADGDNGIISIKKNGTSNFSQSALTASEANDDPVIQVSDQVQFNGSTDFIEIFIQHDAAATLNLSGTEAINHLSAELMKR